MRSPARGLSPVQARRIALAAQGFADVRPAAGTAGMRSLSRVVGHTGLLQIDSVNVVARAQYVPVFSRVGPYDTGLLDRAAGTAPRRLVEYWAHEASLVPPRTRQLLGFRMQAWRDEAWGGMRAIIEKRPDLVADVLAYVGDHPRQTARQVAAAFEPEERRRDNWGWNWSEVKRALEYLFFAGRVTAARRNSSFERVYDLPERVLPADVLAYTPEPDEAHRELIAIAARAHGVARAKDLRDYFRTSPEPTKAAIEQLVEAGRLQPVEVRGHSATWYLDPEARRPRQVAARTLLCPFDPLIFERSRTEALFGFRYRIEIYTPAHKRVHGYYVFPFLLGEELVARVDLKADRAAGRLLVHGAYAEPTAPERTAAELAAALHELAGWLGLAEVEVARRGDLADSLTAQLRP